MSILIGVGIAATIGVIYAGKKSWQALHKAVGITPGVLVYQDPNKPLALADIRWRRLTLHKQHLAVLTEQQWQQLQHIDERVAVYNDYQHSLQQQNVTSAFTEQQFVLHKLLHTRLPEMLASHYHLLKQESKTEDSKQQEASQLLQAMLNDIEIRLESLLEQMQNKHLQDLRVMKQYMDSHS